MAVGILRYSRLATATYAHAEPLVVGGTSLLTGTRHEVLDAIVAQNNGRQLEAAFCATPEEISRSELAADPVAASLEMKLLEGVSQHEQKAKTDLKDAELSQCRALV